MSLLMCCNTQVPLWTLLERHCSEAELLHIAAAMGPAQQRALDSAVTKALTDLMVSSIPAPCLLQHLLLCSTCQPHLLKSSGDQTTVLQLESSQVQAAASATLAPWLPTSLTGLAACDCADCTELKSCIPPPACRLRPQGRKRTPTAATAPRPLHTIAASTTRAPAMLPLQQGVVPQAHLKQQLPAQQPLPSQLRSQVPDHHLHLHCSAWQLMPLPLLGTSKASVPPLQLCHQLSNHHQQQQQPPQLLQTT
jgi:hypothetical protein